MPESTEMAECGATPAWRVSANDIAATGSPHEFVRTLHVKLRVLHVWRNTAGPTAVEAKTQVILDIPAVTFVRTAKRNDS